MPLTFLISECQLLTIKRHCGRLDEPFNPSISDKTFTRILKVKTFV